MSIGDHTHAAPDDGVEDAGLVNTMSALSPYFARAWRNETGEYEHSLARDAVRFAREGSPREMLLLVGFPIEQNEVVATYVDDGSRFEIDHLGIAVDRQFGDFAVYHDGVQVAEFTTDAAGYLPEHRPELPATDTLITLAKAAVIEVETEFGALRY